MLKNKLRISLVIPAYNEENYLGACLEAVLAQEIPFSEIIVVDNNSTDGTIAVAGQFQGVTVLTEPKQGVVHARTAGFDAAKGDIIARIDADTLLPSDWTIKLLQIFSDNTVAAVSGKIEYYDMAAAKFVNTIDLFFRRYFAFVLGREVALQAANMAIRQNAWRDIRSQTCRLRNLHEDFDLAIHTNVTGYNVVFDERLLAKIGYRQAGSTFIDFCRYALISPQTYRAHRLKSRFWMYPVVGIAITFYLILKLLHKGYDVESGKFQFRKLLAPADGMRVNPATYVD